MKLLILNEYCQPFVPGGAEASMMQSARSMQEKGHDVTIVTPNYGTVAQEVIDGVSIKRYWFPARLAKGSRKTTRAWWHTSIFWWLYGSYAVLRATSKIRPDIIHVHGKFSLVSALVARFFYKIPVLFTARDYRALCNYGLCITSHAKRCSTTEYWGWEFAEYVRIYTKGRPQDWAINALYAVRGRMWSSLLRACARRVDKVICVSKAVECIYNKSGVLNTTTIFNIQKKLPETKEVMQSRHRAIAVGKLSPGKGGGFLPDVIIQSLEIDPTLKWEVYTSGGLLYNDFIRVLDTHIKNGSVLVSGYIPNDQLLEKMAQSAVLVIPSVWQEPLTRLALEAQSVGTPVAITDTGGSSEVVRDGETGLVLPLESKAFAQGVVTIARDTDKYRNAIAENRESLLSTFCVQPINQHEHLYKSLIDNKPSALGVMLPPGGSFTVLDHHGQKSRFIFYLEKYAKAFNHVYVFVYEREDIRGLPSNVTVVQPPFDMDKRLYGFLLPFYHRSLIKRCSVIRLTQMDGCIPAIMSTLFWRVPYVATFGYKYAEFVRLNGRIAFSYLMRALERVGIRYASAVIYTTEETKNHLLGRVGPWLAPRLWFVPNGVDTSTFVPKERDSSILLFVGRLEKQKNLFALLQAIADVPKECATRVVWIGRGSQKRALENKAQQLGVELEIIDKVDHAALPEYFGRAGIFTLVSFIEGMPKVLVEAMGAGCCPLVSDADGNRILVEHEKTGYVVGTDSQSIALGLTKLLKNPLLQRRYGDAARSHIVERYDLSATLETETQALKKFDTATPSILRRLFVKPFVSLLKFSKRGSGFSMRIIKWTGRAAVPTHPKHLYSPSSLWALEHIKEGSRVLDVGCSAGAHSMAVSQKAGFVHGFDYDRRRILQAKQAAEREGRKSIIFSHGDATKRFPFAENTLDHVLLLDILEHVYQRDDVLSECVRVLKPGGTLLLALPNRDTKWKQLQRSVGLSSYTDPDHKIEYTLDECKEICQRFGLEVGRVEGVVVDTPWIGIGDAIGALLPRFYKAYAKRRADKVKTHPQESIGFRIVANKPL